MIDREQSNAQKAELPMHDEGIKRTMSEFEFDANLHEISKMQQWAVFYSIKTSNTKKFIVSLSVHDNESIN